MELYDTVSGRNIVAGIVPVLFENGCRGYMDCIQLASDLSHSIGEAFTLFDAAEAKWVVPFPYAKEEFGVDGDVLFHGWTVPADHGR